MTSDDARDKLMAVINRDRDTIDQDLDPGYLTACREWFAALSDAGRQAESRRPKTKIGVRLSLGRS